MADPYASYAISGVVYDPSATVVNGAKVTVEYQQGTSIEIIETTTNSSGQYTLNLANLKTRWADNGIFYLTATKGKQSAEFRVTADGGKSTLVKNLRLEWRELVRDYTAIADGSIASGGINPTVVHSITVTNKASSTAKYVDFRDINDNVICSVYVTAKLTIPVNFGLMGKRFNGGVVVLENATGGVGTATTASDIVTTINSV